MFAPRSLAKRPAWNPIAQPNIHSPAAVTTTTSAATLQHPLLPPDDELLVAVDLILSDYAVWCDPSLGEHMSDGYISLSDIIHLSSSLLKLSPEAQLDSAIAKALRTHPYAQANYEVRMAISDPSSSLSLRKSRTVAGPSASKKATEFGGFEVRRKDWETASERISTNDEGYWRSRTVYIENLPSGIKTGPKIVHFIRSLTSRSSPSDAVGEPASPMINIQGVCFSLPSILNESITQSSNSSEDDRFHGFAFIILGSVEEAQSLTRVWSWDTPSTKSNVTLDDSSSGNASVALAAEARRVGFRSLSLERWEALRDEYRNYQEKLSTIPTGSRSQRQALVDADDMGASSPAPSYPRENTRRPAQSIPKPTPDPSSSTSASHSNESRHVYVDVEAIPSYPTGCLIFLRHIHPQTNKTTLKSLLSRSFSGPDQDAMSMTGKEVDYIDFQKNMDSCHVRLTQPGFSDHLHQYFASRTIYQCSALDEVGSDEPSEQSIKPVTVEIVTGLKEDLYWGQLPEKVRLDALRKAGYTVDGDEQAGATSHPTRKRRRKG